MARLLILLLMFCPVCVEAGLEIYESVIAKQFPGFQILLPDEIGLIEAEMSPVTYRRVKAHPALITGHFNFDKNLDFAAYIRSKTSREEPGYRNERFKSYDGYLVICFGTGNQKYDCTRIAKDPFTVDATGGFIRYLDSIRAGKRFCIELSDFEVPRPRTEYHDKTISIGESYVTFNTDGIGEFRTSGNGDSVYFFKSANQFYQCIVSD